ncbi:hypothetical protein DKM44_07050 [Deinococcus irradiatisoli]|uniref:Uncharacterized protein n=1 Tax=Deinococcus irradiatisoli TaxID=2202254 RepID=A0A2Z3JCW8_9DEIO|nr:hypothetical protein [Deinococcus irradiatisoli]AWN23017.1 hypothetical protein DKM44_07050 [Deinococcus irradiatisoli]
MADSVASPAFDSQLQVNHIEQVNVRGQESWGRWLLGHRAEVLFDAPDNQLIALNFELSLPYENQWVELRFNGTPLFRGLNRSTTAGVVQSRLLVHLRRGQNKLEVLTNRSNRDGLGAPFAKNDGSDISVAVHRLTFQPVQMQEPGLYGPQPSSFIGPRYSSAGPRGLEALFDRSGPLTVEYRLLRRFEHQGFLFDLDGTPVYRLSAEAPGNLLVGHFTVEAAKLEHSKLHVLSVRSQPVPPATMPFLTTTQDNHDVQFYVQQLKLTDTTSRLETNLLIVGAVGVLLILGLWWMLLRPQRS